MKNRSILIIIAGFLLLAIVWWWSRPTPSPTASSATAPSQTTPSSPVQPANAPLTYEPPMKGEYQGRSDPRWKWWQRMEKLDPKFEWKMPIKFYGKAVDQTGQPVPGVRIRYGWNSLNGSNERFDESDAQGTFSIEGIQGKLLSVRLEKEGYHALDNGFGAFEYAAFFEPHYHEPDPNKPVIFRLLKKNPADPMIQHGPTLLGARNDGTPTNIDLTIGRKTTVGSGNIVVHITKGQKTSDNRFDWTATVEGVGGTTLLESKDEFMVMAPAGGYQPQWTFNQKVNDKSYQTQAQVKFYVKTGDGKYARVEMRIIPEYNEAAAADLTVYLNPSGSRNLEFDPQKTIKSP